MGQTLRMYSFSIFPCFVTHTYLLLEPSVDMIISNRFKLVSSLLFKHCWHWRVTVKSIVTHQAKNHKPAKLIQTVKRAVILN